MGLFDIFKAKKTDLTEDVTAIIEGTDLTELFESTDEEFLSNLTPDELPEVIEKMLQDEQVNAEYTTFKSYISDTNYTVQPPEDPLSEAYLEYLDFNGGKLRVLMETFLGALEYGAQIGQINYHDPAETGGLWFPESIKPLDSTRYGFNKSNQIVDKSTGELMEESYPYRFLSMSHNVRNGNLEGNSLVLKAYWPWFFRKACISAGILYVKKSVIPSIVALYKAERNEPERISNANEITERLSKLANSSGVALTNVESIHVVDPKSKGDDLVNLVELFNRMISKAFFGVSTLTNDTSFSSKGNSDSLEKIIESRANKISTQELQPVYNKLLQWLVELNLNATDKSKYPLFKFIYEYDPNFAEMMEALKNRVPLSAEWFYKKYNVTPPENEEDVLISVTAPEPIAARNDAFFLNSERLMNRQSLMKTISKASQKRMAK